MTISWTNLDTDVTDSGLLDYSGRIVLTSRTQFVYCPLTSAQLPFVMEIWQATGSLVAILMFLVLRTLRKVRS